jgi:hypothetical protein
MTTQSIHNHGTVNHQTNAARAKTRGDSRLPNVGEGMFALCAEQMTKADLIEVINDLADRYNKSIKRTDSQIDSDADLAVKNVETVIEVAQSRREQQKRRVMSKSTVERLTALAKSGALGLFAD